MLLDDAHVLLHVLLTCLSCGTSQSACVCTPPCRCQSAAPLQSQWLPAPLQTQPPAASKTQQTDTLSTRCQVNDDTAKYAASSRTVTCTCKAVNMHIEMLAKLCMSTGNLWVSMHTNASLIKLVYAVRDSDLLAFLLFCCGHYMSECCKGHPHQ